MAYLIRNLVGERLSARVRIAYFESPVLEISIGLYVLVDEICDVLNSEGNGDIIYKTTIKSSLIGAIKTISDGTMDIATLYDCRW